MKRFTIAMIALFFVLGFYACATKPLPPPELNYEENAIKIHVDANPQLNISEGKPHTLMVCVYQLRDPNSFNQLAGDQDGLYKLLECKLFDGSVAASKKLFVQPGTNITFNLDRAQGVRYVGIAAGYYLLGKERMIRLYDIPIIVEKVGYSGTKIQKLDILEITLKLGPQQID